VTARHITRNRLSLLREEEGSVVDKIRLNEVISLGDVPFNPYDFGNHINWVSLMKNLVQILSTKITLESFNKITKDKNEEEKKENISDNTIAVDTTISNDTKNDKNNINMKDVLSFRLHSLSGLVLNSLLLDSNILSLFLNEFKNESLPILTRVAFDKCHASCETPTSVIQDRSHHILMMECLQRSRISKEIELELAHDSSLQVLIKEPKIEFPAEFVNVGKRLKKQTNTRSHRIIRINKRLFTRVINIFTLK